MSRVWTTAEVERLTGDDGREIVLRPGDLISPSARDVAAGRGLTVRWADDVVDVDGSSDAGEAPDGECACRAEGDCGCAHAGAAAQATASVVDQDLVARVRALASSIAGARPNASPAEVARETMSALGANGSPGVGTPEPAQPLAGRRFPTKGKGARPSYHADPGLDAVISMVTTLTSEVWVLRERVMTLEALLAEKRAIEPDAVDAHLATGADAEARLGAARAFVGRVLRVFYEWREEIVGDETQDAYHEVIRRAFGQAKVNT
jgi:hypothetical protein